MNKFIYMFSSFAVALLALLPLSGKKAGALSSKETSFQTARLQVNQTTLVLHNPGCNCPQCQQARIDLLTTHQTTS